MAQGTKTTNTMAEQLRVIMGDITDAKLAPDADLPFLINLETQIVGYLQAKADEALTPPGQPGAMAGAMGGGPGGPGPGGPMGGGPPSPGGMAGSIPGGMGAPRQVPGVMQGPNLPNPDELRRVLSQ